MRKGYLERKADKKEPLQSRVQKIGCEYGHKEAFLGEERAQVRHAVSGPLRRSASVLFFFFARTLFKVRMGLLLLLSLSNTTLLH